MAGKPGRSGGKRPGAGAKSDATKTRQQTMRSAFEEACGYDDWLMIARVMVSRAKTGDVAMIRELSPWIVGKVPDESNIHVDGAMTFYLPERGDIASSDS